MSTTDETTPALDPIDRSRRVTGEARDKAAAGIIAKYKAGASIRAIALEIGRSFGFVHRIISEAAAREEVVIRSRGGANRYRQQS